MKRTLRALIVEDRDDDRVLLVRALERGGFDVVHERVESAESMAAALGAREWDVVLSDYSLPSFSALQALEVLKSTGIDLPFIVVSGTIGEETAVEALRAGAHDFLVKRAFARLVPAIERELREAANRREKRKAVFALRQAETKFREQLMVSDRMASVGILAAGVAHEINNPLTALVGNVEFALREVDAMVSRLGDTPEFRRLRERLEVARDATERVRRTAMDLKMFARTQDHERAPVDVRRVVESALSRVRNEARHRARIVTDLQPVPRVLANEGRLGQVVLNLLINAMQAIEEERADANEIRVATRALGAGWIVLEVRDTGTGMSPEVQRRLFTPFFTTKPVGVGTGLGLSICHNIVTALGGVIDVETALGKGTTFRIRLPALPPDEVAEPQAAPTEPATASPTPRRGRVLVVDDEPSIVEVVRLSLMEEHDVTATTDARDAFARISTGARFDVIYCDLVMPHMTGMDLHQAVRAIAPDQAERMVFLTGGAFTPRARAFLDEVEDRFVAKPFRPAELLARTNELMRSSRPA